MRSVKLDSSYWTDLPGHAPPRYRAARWAGLALALCMGWLPPHGANLLSAFPADSGKTEGKPGEYESFVPAGDIRRFVGETLLIDISFLWFDNAATASVRFYKKGGNYYSVLESETIGFVGFFTSYRKHRYKSTFDIVDNGRRVRSRKFEREASNASEGSTASILLV